MPQPLRWIAPALRDFGIDDSVSREPDQDNPTGGAEPVALRHYLQATDDHVERAADCGTLQNALQPTSESPCTAAKAENSKTANTPETIGEFAAMQGGSQIDKMRSMGDIGLEPTTSSV